MFIYWSIHYYKEIHFSIHASRRSSHTERWVAHSPNVLSDDVFEQHRFPQCLAPRCRCCLSSRRSNNAAFNGAASGVSWKRSTTSGLSRHCAPPDGTTGAVSNALSDVPAAAAQLLGHPGAFCWGELLPKASVWSAGAPESKCILLLALVASRLAHLPGETHMPPPRPSLPST